MTVIAGWLENPMAVIAGWLEDPVAALGVVAGGRAALERNRGGAEGAVRGVVGVLAALPEYRDRKSPDTSPVSPWERPVSAAIIPARPPKPLLSLPENPRLSRRHDQSYKLLFSLPLTIEHLIRGFIDADLADELDFRRMESLATERTTSGLVRSHADLIWRIHFRGSSSYLLLPIEFQSGPDRYMAARALYYVAVAYHGLLARKTRRLRLAPGGLLPPTLAATIYNGRDRWTAPVDVRDLIEPARGWLADRQPKLVHEVLDLRALARRPLPERNVVAWIARMELDSSPGNVSRVVREVLDAYPGPEHRRLREAFREWILGAARSWGIGEEVLTQVETLKEAGMVYAGVEELKERAHREGLGEGIRKGRAEGRAAERRTIVRRLARLKFGADTAERLSRLLEGISEPERIARIGDRIIQCETGSELLARAREV